MIKTRKVDVKITNPDGSVVFKKPGFTVPKDWSDTAATIMASKFANTNENSTIDIINRVVSSISEWGVEQKYFGPRSKERQDFEELLTDILVNQRASFNSPVWFNAGVPTNKRQMSACFVLPIEDTMDAILKHTVVEGNIFKSGSGTGINVSKLRAKGELLSNRGHASGPISFMKGWDAFAGVIKSGGKVRRAAKLVCLDADHPDIFEFIECKRIEENKAKLLIKAGIDPEEAYATVAFQNTNHSIRVTDKFMEAAKVEGKWDLINRGNGEVADAVCADSILQKTAEVAWEIGDPGIQFHNRMNIDNPVPALGEIRATNPCSEFCSVDYGACNLASLNLAKYLDQDNDLDEAKFNADIDVLITAMDILVEAAEYPTPEIREMTLKTRPLGLGFSNLGAYLMAKGLPYDSEEARTEASYVTRAMTTEAYRASIALGAKMGAFPAIQKEVSANIARRLTERDDVAMAILESGMRNSQLTLLAPTGTISFVMDCDTTGIEPLFALRSTKKLAGGGTLDLIPECVKEACNKLREEGVEAYIDTIEALEDRHKAIFKTANEIDWKDHILMMAACQRYLNGAISKTINMPNDCTVEDVKKAYRFAWKRGLKSLTIYRDGSKVLQPLSDATKTKDEEEAQEDIQWTPVRRKLPDTRQSVTHKFNIGGFEGYITAGMYEDGTPGEVFINSQKQGNWANGMLDAFATILSMALQYGVPLESLKRKFVGTRFEPAGFTNNEDIRLCTSLMDYIFRWLGLEFLDEEDEAYDGPVIPSIVPQEPTKEIDASGPPCINCGNPTMRSGTCFVCRSCGTQGGCG